jgi:hypothetical protein
MSWGDMIFSGGSALLKAGLSYSAASDKAKSDRKWQAYNNAMLNISGALAQNDVTQNEVFARERSIQAGIAIKKSEFLTEASAENGAAAAGTTGRSVNAVLFDVQRNAATAESNMENEAQNQEVAFQNQRQKIAQQVLTQTDVRTIPSPNPVTTMLGLGGDIGKLYKNDSKEMDQIFAGITNLL